MVHILGDDVRAAACIVLAAILFGFLDVVYLALFVAVVALTLSVPAFILAWGVRRDHQALLEQRKETIRELKQTADSIDEKLRSEPDA